MWKQIKNIICKWPLWKIEFDQLEENKFVYSCVYVYMLTESVNK